MLPTAPLTSVTPRGNGTPQLDAILSEREIANWLGVSTATLQRWRAQGYGPTWMRLSERRLGYRTSEIDRWLKSREQPGGSLTPRGEGRYEGAPSTKVV